MKGQILLLFGIVSQVFFLSPWSQEGDAAENHLRMPHASIPFIANEGQYPSEVEFYTCTFCGTVFVTRDSKICYSLPCFEGEEAPKGWVLRESLMGCLPFEPQGATRIPTKVSFFKGKDPSKWKRSLPVYRTLDLGEVYPGIEMKLHAREGNIEKRFLIRPGVETNVIQIRMEGAKGLRLGKTRELLVETGCGIVGFTKPVAYQEDREGKRFVDVRYTVEDDTYGFSVGEYDREKPLVIDPLLASTYIGGSSGEGMGGCATLVRDDEGYVYLAGYTNSLDFPSTPGAYCETYVGGGYDVFVSKFDSSLKTLKASTFLGGSGKDWGYRGIALALGESGCLYVTGQTTSSDFPTTPGAYDETYNGQDDVFLARFTTDLSLLTACTLLGASGYELANSLVLDPGGTVFVAGQTRSSDFPTTPDAFDKTYGGTSQPWGGDIFVSRLDACLSTLEASTYLGDKAMEFNGYLTLDGDGNPYVVGTTASEDFPTTSGAYQENHSGSTGGYDVDIFISRLDRDLTTLLNSTFLGGILDDWGYAPLVLDHVGNIYVTGHTSSQDYPTTPGAYDTTYNGKPGVDVGDDIPLTKMDGDLTTLLASTYVGGSDWDGAMALGKDKEGHVYLAGLAQSSDFPVTTNSFDETFNGLPEDAVVLKLTGDLDALVASTYLGGAKRERALALLLDPEGDVYVAGATKSGDFPTTPDAYDENYSGGTGYDGDTFISKLDGGLSVDTLKTDLKEVSATIGGVAHFTLTSGVQNKNRIYLILGSVSGTDPGLPLPGGNSTLPINWDLFTDFVCTMVNTALFVDFFGTLDGSGNSSAHLDTLGPLDPACVGIKMYFAYVLSGPPWDFVSNPVKITIVN